MDENDAGTGARRRLLVAAFLSTIAILLSFVLVAVQVIERRNAADEQRMLLCEAENASRDALRQILVLAQTLPSDDRTPEEHRRSDRFFARAYVLIQPIDCSLFEQSPQVKADL